MNIENDSIILTTNNLCRTCMNTSNNLVSLFDYLDLNVKREQLSSILLKCTSIQVTKNDIYSHFICVVCLKRLTDAYLFREECYRTHEKFEQLYQNHNAFCPCPTSSEDALHILNEHFKNDKNEKSECIENSQLLHESVTFANQHSIGNCDDHSLSENLANTCDNDNTCDSTNSTDLKLSNETKLLELTKNCDNKNETEGISKFTCQECQKVFYSEYGLKNHRKIHFNDNLKCSSCGKRFTRTSDVKRHMLTHSGLKPYTCNVCGNSFTQSGTLAIHMRKHEEFKHLEKTKKRMETKPHLCSICGKSFKESSSLTIHIRRHLGHKPFCCDICNMRFVSSGRLTSHKRIHTGERPFTCKYCAKSFSHCTVLSRHLKTHLEIKPYQCGHCPKSFSTHYCLNIHKRKHTGEKPLKCLICQKSFSDPKSLKQHTKIHTEEKPFSCMICGKAFRRSHHLKSHMTIHTK